MTTDMTPNGAPALEAIRGMQECSSQLQRYLGAYGDNADFAMINELSRKRPLLIKIWPSPLQKKADEILANQYETAAQARTAAFSLCVDLQLAMAKSQGEAQLAEIGMRGARDVTASARVYMDQITEEVEESRDSFAITMEARLEKLEAMRGKPYLAPLFHGMQASIVSQLDNYWDFLDKLLSRFTASLDARLTLQSKPME